jgi:hypothetical protein
MGVIFFYGLSTQTAIVAWVSVIGVALSFGIGILVVWRASPSSPFFVELEERRRSGRMEEATVGDGLQPSQPEQA